MKLLAFDTSTDPLSIAVQHGTQVWQYSGPGGAQSSASLIPAILDLLQQAGLTLEAPENSVFETSPVSLDIMRRLAERLAAQRGLMIAIDYGYAQFAFGETVQAVLDSGQLSIFTGGYWEHPDYRLPPEANLMAVSHYLDALEFQRSMIRINTVFGGKNEVGLTIDELLAREAQL